MILLNIAVPQIWPANEDSYPVFPPYPDKPRVVWIDEIRMSELKPKSSLLGKLRNIIAGNSSFDELSLPFDIVVTGNSYFLTCQSIPALVEVDRDNNSFKLHTCDESPITYPISLCLAEDNILFTDSENDMVYKYDGRKVVPFIISGLTRPTGITFDPKNKTIYIIDTGDHEIKLYDSNGVKLKSIVSTGMQDDNFNYPTFATTDSVHGVWINDAMNYRMKQLDHNGKLISEFGTEGDGPGSLARPKGIATDSDSHLWVVDNIFDNVQLFDADGNILLVIGTSGTEKGQFWSPSGIDICNDTVYIADTFNNRIQVLHYLRD